MLDVTRFLGALRSEDGLEREGVHLPADTLAHLRGHEAYAFAWFENWSRDGQPPGGRVAFDSPYPTSPEVDVSDFAVAGYARTGDEPASPASERPATRRALRAASERDGAGRAVVVAPAAYEPQLATPRAPGPGWYPSPSSTGHEQWWDGSAWTPERRPIALRPRGLARFLRRRQAVEQRISG